jgi:hypothetical protein
MIGFSSIYGVVAQLGACLNRTQEVKGSNPFNSTIKSRTNARFLRLVKSSNNRLPTDPVSLEKTSFDEWLHHKRSFGIGLQYLKLVC